MFSPAAFPFVSAHVSPSNSLPSKAPAANILQVSHDLGTDPNLLYIDRCHLSLRRCRSYITVQACSMVCFSNDLPGAVVVWARCFVPRSGLLAQAGHLSSTLSDAVAHRSRGETVSATLLLRYALLTSIAGGCACGRARACCTPASFFLTVAKSDHDSTTSAGRYVTHRAMIESISRARISTL
jgi:hypothetical protein